MTALNHRNDPTPGEPYGQCTACGLAHQTREESDRHQQEMLEAAIAADPRATSHRSGHSTRILNPSRADRVKHQVEDILQSAIESFPGRYYLGTGEYDVDEEAIARAMEDLHAAVDRGDVSAQEVTRELRFQPEFLTPWKQDLPDYLDIPAEQGDLLEGLTS